MTVLLDTALASLLHNYADAIEGGNGWRGSGTAYKGIPGRYSNDPGLRDADATLTVSAAVSTTQFRVATPSQWRANRWTPDNCGAFWVLGATGTLVGKHRKLTAYAYTAAVVDPPADAYGTFTVGTAFGSAPQPADTFSVLQGFKRVPNGVDIEGDRGTTDGYDRCFHLSANPGKVLNWYGSSVAVYETTLRLRLRLCKFSRLHDWTAAVMTNAAIIRQALVRREHYDGVYTMALSPLGGECVVIKDDKDKVVVQDSYRLLYQVRQDFS